MAHLKPVTPGELLREEFLVPMGLTQYRVAKEIGVPAQRLGEIVAGRRAITADTDFRLCRFFGLTTSCCRRDAGCPDRGSRATFWRRGINVTGPRAAQQNSRRQEA